MNASSRRIGKFTFGHAGLVVAVLLVAACEQGPSGSGAGSLADHAAMTVDHVVATGQACGPTGKHDKHAGFACTVCHQCAGTLSFDATVAGPNAAFDATTKNCSSIQCHSVPAGTFSYNGVDGDGSTILITVPYGGEAGSGTANWYSTGTSSCDACHGYPPKYNGVAYPWHTGSHASPTTSRANTCQVCHPDATGAYVWGGLPSYVNTSGGLITSCPVGTFCSAPGTITQPALHGNGTLDVVPQFSSRCSYCH